MKGNIYLLCNIENKTSLRLTGIVATVRSFKTCFKNPLKRAPNGSFLGISV